MYGVRWKEEYDAVWMGREGIGYRFGPINAIFG
jgi:hypothetical protein